MIKRWIRRILRLERHDPKDWPGDGDVIRVILSPGRSTMKRPDETWAEAMNRLTDGHDL